MPKMTDEDRAEVARLLAIAEGRAPHLYYDDRDAEDAPLDEYKETMTVAELAYLDSVITRETKN